MNVKDEYHTFHNRIDDICDEFSENFRISLSGLIEGLDQQRQDGSFCDVELISEKKIFHAHRCILSATSPYFKGNSH